MFEFHIEITPKEMFNSAQGLHLDIMFIRFKTISASRYHVYKVLKSVTPKKHTYRSF